ncbi:MAG TPA: Na-translocating system protein MpsC family protein [Solirubrobacterales bacterium]|nr:Na-translocating system protein MpsC family protein [Solirubrobacterales bacterium]
MAASDTAVTPAEGQARGETLASISTGLVQLHSRYYGKGPTKAKTFLFDDTVVCLLRGGFTTVERTLIEQGNAEAVHSIRRSFQDAMEGPFTSLVEAATGRKVIAYMSQVHEAAEIAAELFVLEPSEQAVVQAGEQELHGGEELAT